MKKIIVILIILIALVLANTLIKKNPTDQKAKSTNLAEVIGINTAQSRLYSEVKITIGENEIHIKEDEWVLDVDCYIIMIIGYCANGHNTFALTKFLTNEIKDVYEKNDKNLKRLGFDLKEESNSISIDNFKTLWLGNVNQYGEIYVLHINKIYKVDYYKSLSNVSTKEWIDKSSQLIDLLDRDAFHIKIQNKRTMKNMTAQEILDDPFQSSSYDSYCSFTHEQLISNSELSIIRNSFIDLYAEDIVRVRAEGAAHLPYAEMDPHIIVNLIGDKDPISWTYFNDEIRKIQLNKDQLSQDQNFQLEKIDQQSLSLVVWKKDHLVYMSSENVAKLSMGGNFTAFVIPNVVYDNLNIDCKKIKSNLKNQ